MRRRFLRGATALVIAVALSTCSETPTAGRSRARLGFGVTLAPATQKVAATLPDFGIVLDNVHVTLTRPPQTVVKDTSIAFPPAASEIAIALDVELASDEETLIARVELESGTTPMFAGSKDLVVRVKDTPSAQDVVLSEYVGPGKDAQRLTIQPTSATIFTNASRQFSVVASRNDESVVSRLPVAWSTGDASIATVSSSGLAAAAGKKGTVQITVQAINGLAATAPLQVILPPNRILVLDGSDQAAPVGTTLERPFVVQVF